MTMSLSCHQAEGAGRRARFEKESRSEPPLRNDQHIAGPDVDVRGNVTALQEVLEPDAVLLAVFLASNEHGSVAIGEVGQTADLDHHVQQGHVLPVRYRLWLGRLADDPDLLAGNPLE